MGLFEDLNEKGFLAIGTNPQWADIALADTEGAPSAPSAGVFLEDSPKAQVYVAMRDDVSKRYSRIEVTIGDVATTYTVTVDGNVVNTTPAGAALAAVALEIRNDINADGVVNLIVVATIDPDDSTGATVLLKGIAEDDYSIDATVAGGTGAVSSTADASSCDIRIYTTPGGTIPSSQVGNAQRWVQPLDGHYPAIDYRGFDERFHTAGVDRLAVELETVAGAAADGSTVVLTAHIMVGPAVL